MSVEKQKFTKNWGLFANMQKAFFCLFSGALGFCAFLWGSFSEKPQKGHFRAVLEVLSSSVAPKGLSFESFSSSYFGVFLFVFCLPFPFWDVSSVILFLLPFPLLVFACFFEISFPNIPFSKPTCFNHWLFLFLLLLVLFSCYMSLLLCFMLALFLACFLLLLFCFCFVSGFGIQTMKNIVFSAFLVFFESCWLKVVYLHAFCFWSCCFFLCCLFPV